jgi:hypothetical protein
LNVELGIAQWLTTLDAHTCERFEERVGIREYEGGLSRQEAELAAYHDVQPKIPDMNRS